MSNYPLIHTDPDTPVTDLEPILEYSSHGVMLSPYAVIYYRVMLYSGTLVVSVDVSGMRSEEVHKELRFDFTQTEFEELLDGIEYLRDAKKEQNRDLIDGGSQKIRSSYLNCYIEGNHNMIQWTKFLRLFEKMFAMPSYEQLVGEMVDSISQ